MIKMQQCPTCATKSLAIAFCESYEPHPRIQGRCRKCGHGRVCHSLKLKETSQNSPVVLRASPNNSPATETKGQPWTTKPLPPLPVTNNLNTGNKFTVKTAHTPNRASTLKSHTSHPEAKALSKAHRKAKKAQTADQLRGNVPATKEEFSRRAALLDKKKKALSDRGSRRRKIHTIFSSSGGGEEAAAAFSKGHRRSGSGGHSPATDRVVVAGQPDYFSQNNHRKIAVPSLDTSFRSPSSPSLSSSSSLSAKDAGVGATYPRPHSSRSHPKKSLSEGSDLTALKKGESEKHRAELLKKGSGRRFTISEASGKKLKQLRIAEKDLGGSPKKEHGSMSMRRKEVSKKTKKISGSMKRKLTKQRPTIPTRFRSQSVDLCHVT